MTVSLLDKAFGVSGLNQTAIKHVDDKIIIEAEMTHSGFSCPHCQGSKGIFRGKKTRVFHIPPVGSKKSFLSLKLHRVQCLSCGHLHWPTLSFMPGTKRMTYSFIHYALELLKFGTIKDVANHLGVGWDTVKEIHKDALQKKYAEIPLEELEYVTVDEFSIRKRHKYMTVFTDLATARIIHAVEGRKQKDIEPFLKELKKKPLSESDLHGFK